MADLVCDGGARRCVVDSFLLSYAEDLAWP